MRLGAILRPMVGPALDQAAVAPSLDYVECPRDAWQGLARTIPTSTKRAHLAALLSAGFRRLDLGSFVSPRAVPQLADTDEVLAGLDAPVNADLLCIVANARGLERARSAPNLTSVGYPLSVSDTFQRRNTNRSLADSWPLVEALLGGAGEAGLTLVVYLSMGFGNPYGDAWEPATTADAVERLRAIGVERVVLADTVATASPERIAAVLAATPRPAELGLHLHAHPGRWQGQLDAALAAGVRWFEGALAGVGGCPFAADELVGNLPTEEVLPWLASRGFASGVRQSALAGLAREAAELAARYGTPDAPE